MLCNLSELNNARFQESTETDLEMFLLNFFFF